MLRLVAVVLLVALVVYVATRPATFRVERTALVQAPVGVVFALVNDLRAYQRWNPYEQPGVRMERTFEGPAAGPGASYAWDGDRKVGAGQMTIVDSLSAPQEPPLEAHRLPAAQRRRRASEE